MISKRISEQVNIIRIATNKASASPETALAFLRNAGIVPQEEQGRSSGHTISATAQSQTSAHRPPPNSAPTKLTLSMLKLVLCNADCEIAKY